MGYVQEVQTEVSLDKLVNVYLCNRYGKDPTKCIDCESLQGCPAGKRAVEILEEMTSEKKKTPGRILGAKVTAEKARARAIEAVESGDPWDYLVRVQGITKNSAIGLISRWRKKYPDILAGVPKCKSSGRPKKCEPEEEEVSLADFLSEHDQEKTAEPTQEDIDQSIKEAEKAFDEILQPEEPSRTEEYISADSFAFEIEKKYRQLMLREQDISDQIERLENELKWIEKAKESLAMVKNLFDRKSLIGSALQAR